MSATPSNVLRNLQEFRKEKQAEKAKLREKQEEEQTNQWKQAQKAAEEVAKKEKSSRADWDFLTRAEPVDEDYGELWGVEKLTKFAVFVSLKLSLQYFKGA